MAVINVDFKIKIKNVKGRNKVVYVLGLNRSCTLLCNVQCSLTKWLFVSLVKKKEMCISVLLQKKTIL